MWETDEFITTHGKILVYVGRVIKSSFLCGFLQVGQRRRTSFKSQDHSVKRDDPHFHRRVLRL